MIWSSYAFMLGASAEPSRDMAPGTGVFFGGPISSLPRRLNVPIRHAFQSANRVSIWDGTASLVDRGLVGLQPARRGESLWQNWTYKNLRARSFGWAQRHQRRVDRHGRRGSDRTVLTPRTVASFGSACIQISAKWLVCGQFILPRPPRRRAAIEESASAHRILLACVR